MYHFSPDKTEQKRLYHRRHTSDYWNNGTDEHTYVPPPVSKPIQKRHSFVHNAIANKTKSNVEFVEDILSNEVLNPKKRKILLALHHHKIDFRMLMAFKNALFDSEELEDNQFVPLSVWNEVGEYQMNHLLSMHAELNKLLLSEVMDNVTEKIDLCKFNDIVDLFFYLPKKLRKNARNESENMWYICSSNVHKGPMPTTDIGSQGGKLK